MDSTNRWPEVVTWAEWPESDESLIEWLYLRTELSPSSFDILMGAFKGKVKPPCTK